MDVRDMEDLVASLFDPLLSLAEKENQLLSHTTTSARTLDEAGFHSVSHGVEIEFTDGSRFHLVIIHDQTR